MSKPSDTAGEGCVAAPGAPGTKEQPTPDGPRRPADTVAGPDDHCIPCMGHGLAHAVVPHLPRANTAMMRSGMDQPTVWLKKVEEQPAKG